MAARLLRSQMQPWRRRALAGGASVTLSESRLQEFMKAEIGHFALMSPRPVKLTQILSTTQSHQVAELIHHQLPRHMATRIKHIETMPHWNTIPELVEVHAILADSFRNLRLVEQGPDLEPLAKVLRDIRTRHKPVINLLGSAVATLRAGEAIEESFANQWLDTFLLARIGTEMLSAHFMSMYTNGEDAANHDSVTGIVDSRCNPGEICRAAAKHISEEPEFASVNINVESHVCSSSRSDIEFSFMPRYLSTIMEELLKNSAAATIRHRLDVGGNRKAEDETINVIVTADQRQVKICISDKGGGIPSSAGVWSYCPHTLEDHKGDTSWSDPVTGAMTSWTDPLAGLGIKRRVGMGLPLSRLYTEYLGGSLELMSLSGIGVDAYLSLSRIDVASAGHGQFE